MVAPGDQARLNAAPEGKAPEHLSPSVRGIDKVAPALSQIAAPSPVGGTLIWLCTSQVTHYYGSWICGLTGAR